VPASQQTTYRVIPNLQIPTVYVAGGQVERQLPHNFTVSVGAYAVRVLHVIRARDINAPLPGTITVANPGGTRPNPAVGEIYQFEASGRLHQEHLLVGFNSRLNPQFSLSGGYSLSTSTNDTDAPGSFPMNSYDLSGEFGRAGFDVRHRFNLFGTYTSKLWKVVFSPFVTASSAPPFNITTGIDSNLDRQYTERPSFAPAGANCTSLFIRCTKYGNFNLVPAPGEQIIQRNYGQASGSFTANLRITRTFGFGGETAAAKQRNAQNEKSSSGGPGGPGSRGPMINTGGGGGGGSERGGGGGMGGGGASDKKYTLTLSLYVQNILNTVNLGSYVGNLSSPQFGQPQSVAGSFGGFGGGGGSPNAGNRRIYLNMRFSF